MKAYKTTIPDNSLITAYLPCDFADAFAVDLPSPISLTADDIQIRFWTDMPAWVDFLMKLRNIMVRPFGLKGTENSVEEFRNAIRTGSNCGGMTMVKKSENETLIKLDDKHLAAYISVLVESERVSVITAVHFNNAMGRVYIAIIKPFHKILVKSTLKRAVK